MWPAITGVVYIQTLLKTIDYYFYLHKENNYFLFIELMISRGWSSGGSRSCFTENKMVLSQFMKNKDIMKITVHGELNIYFSFHGK